MDLVLKFFKDFVFNISLREGNLEILMMGLWYWFFVLFFNGFEKEDIWLLFFFFLGVFLFDLNLEKKGFFFLNWLESCVFFWGKELFFL